MAAWTPARQQELVQGVCRVKRARPWQAATAVALIGLATVQGLSEASDSGFHWTPAKVVLAIFLFLAAGLCEIGGGWLVWQAVREGKPFYWGIAGSLVLVGYGFLPTAQPTSNFGRIYAVYGGFFIVLSYAWGWVFDKERPDTGDYVGAAIALIGVIVALFYPR
ncbi:g5051 [Coccomyxa elongata]